MRNIKFGLVYVLTLIVLLTSAGGLAFGQSNIPGFRGMDRHKKKIVPPPPPAETVASPNTDCTLTIPGSPLTPAGLATPYLLSATDPTQGPCNEANTAQSTFVSAAIFDPATSKIWIYNPLVIDAGTSPAVAPPVPSFPTNAIVAIWFGYNADNLTLVATNPGDLAAANCVNGSSGTVFTQYAYCNAPALFTAANTAIANGTLKVPPLGRAIDGQSCPTVRDFFIVDQDQSDNLPTLYILTAGGAIAQRTQANLAAFPGATTLGNPSDNRLMDVFVDGALHCTPWTAPDLADPGQNVPALVLNELQARMLQGTPMALVPDGDPMAEVNGNYDLTKTNLYRVGVNQPVGESYFDVDTSRYCREMLRVAPARMFRNEWALSSYVTPVPSAANTLFTFLAERFVASYEILNCSTLISEDDPIIVTTNSDGVAVNARLNLLTYMKELQDIGDEKTSDDAADNSASLRGAME